MKRSDRQGLPSVCYRDSLEHFLGANRPQQCDWPLDILGISGQYRPFPIAVQFSGYYLA